MDRYVRVEQAKPEQSNITDNEVCVPSVCPLNVKMLTASNSFQSQVRIMAAGQVRNYITYATSLLTVRFSLVSNVPLDIHKNCDSST